MALYHGTLSRALGRKCSLESDGDWKLFDISISREIKVVKSILLMSSLRQANLVMRNLLYSQIEDFPRIGRYWVYVYMYVCICVYFTNTFSFLVDNQGPKRKVT